MTNHSCYNYECSRPIGPTDNHIKIMKLLDGDDNFYYQYFCSYECKNTYSRNNSCESCGETTDIDNSKTINEYKYCIKCDPGEVSCYDEKQLKDSKCIFCLTKYSETDACKDHLNFRFWRENNKILFICTKCCNILFFNKIEFCNICESDDIEHNTLNYANNPNHISLCQTCYDVKNRYETELKKIPNTL